MKSKHTINQQWLIQWSSFGSKTAQLLPICYNSACSPTPNPFAPFAKFRICHWDRCLCDRQSEKLVVSINHRIFTTVKIQPPKCAVILPQYTMWFFEKGRENQRDIIPMFYAFCSGLSFKRSEGVYRSINDCELNFLHEYCELSRFLDLWSTQNAPKSHSKPHVVRLDLIRTPFQSLNEWNDVTIFAMDAGSVYNRLRLTEDVFAFLLELGLDHLLSTDAARLSREVEKHWDVVALLRYAHQQTLRYHRLHAKHTGK